MTIFLLKLIRGPRCSGCGRMDWMVTKNSHLCLPCYELYQCIAERKAKLDGTLRVKFAWPAEKIREFVKVFRGEA